MKVAVRIAVAIAVALMMQACAFMVETKVSRIHSLPPDISGKRFAIVPRDEQRGRQEFELYASDIAARLMGRGMVQSQTLNEADYFLVIHYDTGNARTITSQVPVYGWVPGNTSITTGSIKPSMGGGARFRATTVTPEDFVEVGSESVSETVYTSVLDVALMDKARTIETKRGVIFIYEGRAVSTGPDDSFLGISKCMIDALLADFPAKAVARKQSRQHCRLARGDASDMTDEAFTRGARPILLVVILAILREVFAWLWRITDKPKGTDAGSGYPVRFLWFSA